MIEQAIRCVCAEFHMSVLEFVTHFFQKHTQGHRALDSYTCEFCHQTYENIILGYTHFLEDHTFHMFFCVNCLQAYDTHWEANEHNVCRCPACAETPCICQYDEEEIEEYNQRMNEFYHPYQ